MNRLLTAAFATTALVVLGASAIGCGDSEGPLGGSGGDETGGTGGTGAGEPTCQDKGGQCLAIPEGFLGPIEIHDDGIATCTNAAFQGGYDDQELTFEPAECGCTCTSEATCTFTATAYDNGQCSEGKALFTSFDLAEDGSCTTAPILKLTPVEGVFVGATPDTEECTNDGAQANIAPVAFDPPVDGCNVTLDPCEAGVICFPDSVKTYCVYSDTETSCPSSFPVERRVIREEDVTDTRDCTCACGDGTVDCSVDVALFTDDACTNELTAVQEGNCFSGDDGQDILSVTGTTTATDTCGDATTENVTGDVTITGEGVLVCCLAE